ncbi:MAG: phage terminase large subunit [Hyphomonadaceae bacterium]|nr:phage terminase large subunit [Hyphomonadaceae bacterium]
MSVALPAWILGHNPGSKLICASYGQDLADDLARKCLAIMVSDWYERAFQTRVSANRRAVSDFHTTKRGYRRSASVGGALTGFGADTIIVDDAQKPGEALSEAMRRAANAWFDETLFSRLNSKSEGCIIIVMQRLHEDDLVGHVLAQGEDWEVVNFPAIAETDELHAWSNAFGAGQHFRREGEALHPAREPISVLEGIRRQMGTYLFSAQYQQDPIPREGARINVNWFNRFDAAMHMEFNRIVQSWDTASKPSEFSDFCVCTTWGQKGDKLYLLHVYRSRLLYPDLEKKVIALCDNWNASLVIIEDHDAGRALVQNLPAQGFYKAKAFKPRGDKAMRMDANTGMIEFGRVFVPREAPWLDDYLKELQAFPNGRFDDQVDSTSQALEWINGEGREPNLLAYYRQEGERLKPQPSASFVQLRAPQHPEPGGSLSGSYGNINADAQGIYHVPADQLDKKQLGTLLTLGWKIVE